MSATSTIQAAAIAKTFRSWGRRVRALDGVSLQVSRGEVFGLLGANGAGKTTLVKILLGLTHPTEGSAALRGVTPFDARARLRVGYLPEGHRFPGYLDGTAALRLFGRLAGVGERQLDRRIPALLDLVGLGERGRDRIGRYSKGMTQRLGLAAALVDEPEILFLDEPTDGVDPVGRRHIRDVLLAEKARGATIFINSHLLSEVERTCDRVAVLHQGRLLREGSIADLTQPLASFRIRVAAGDAPLPEIPGTVVAADNGTRALDADSVETLNVAIDRLRADGQLITEVAPLRSDLEDVFVQLVSGAREAGRPAPAADRTEGGGR